MGFNSMFKGLNNELLGHREMTDTVFYFYIHSCWYITALIETETRGSITAQDKLVTAILRGKIFQEKVSELENILIRKRRNILNFFVIYNFLHLTFRKMNLMSTYFVLFISVWRIEERNVFYQYCRDNIRFSIEMALESGPCLFFLVICGSFHKTIRSWHLAEAMLSSSIHERRWTLLSVLFFIHAVSKRHH